MNPLDDIDQQIENLLHPNFKVLLDIETACIHNNVTHRSLVVSKNINAILTEIWEISIHFKIYPVSVLILDRHKKIVLNTTFKFVKGDVAYFNNHSTAYLTMLFTIHFIIDDKVLKYYFRHSNDYFNGSMDLRNKEDEYPSFYNSLVDKEASFLKNIVRVLFSTRYDLPTTAIDKEFIIIFHEINISEKTWHYSVRSIE